MIGVIAKDFQREVVREFFEYFKVPWMFYQHDGKYDIVIITDDIDTLPEATLIIVYGAEIKRSDDNNPPQNIQQPRPLLLNHEDLEFPVYGEVASFEVFEGAFLKSLVMNKAVGFSSSLPQGKIFRIGYDLFEEIALLLSRGQPEEYAIFPTIELHVHLLRMWMIEAGIAFVEIPPIPAGHKFIVCLTHDVDFVGIRPHRLDRTALGFIARVFKPPYLRDLEGRISWTRVVKNWASLMTLPAVYLGWARDFWYDFDRYLELEKGLASTFYFVPFPGVPGGGRDEIPPTRAVKYDVRDHALLLRELVGKGCEIGLHGLDAWHDSRKGRDELSVIRGISGADVNGVRMHWLYFSDDTPLALAEAGVLYDSSVGYNETIGFKSGSSQVYPLPGGSKVFELPLHLMDTAMFSQGRMKLTECDAMKRCQGLIRRMIEVGGVLTINWHTRSLTPERNWDDFYLELLRALKEADPWFASGNEAVNWFLKRRSVRFKEVAFSEDSVVVRFEASERDHLPPLMLRVYPSRVGSSTPIDERRPSFRMIQTALAGDPLVEVAF